MALFLGMWSLILGTLQFCGAFVAPVPSGAETEPNGAQVHGAAASSGAIETDLENAQFDGAVASPLGFETELKDVQFVDMVASSSGFETEVKDAQFFEAEAKSGFKTPRSRGLMVASAGPLRCVDPGKGDAGHLGRRLVWMIYLFVSYRVEDPSSRVARVNTALHQNSHSALARSLHDVHVARCVQNSMNSLGCTRKGCLRTWRNKVTEYEYSDWGQAFCCVWVRSYTADAFEVACRDVGRPSV